jgi:hypothetical protein
MSNQADPTNPKARQARLDFLRDLIRMCVGQGVDPKPEWLAERHRLTRAKRAVRTRGPVED